MIKRRVTRIYYEMRRNSKRRGHQLPIFTKDELFIWVISQQNFNSIMAVWESKDFNVDDMPTVDRIDPMIGYQFDNMQLLSWRDHDVKSGLEKHDGSDKRQWKQVLAINKWSGNKKEFESQKIAAKELGISHSNINSVVKGNRKTAGGYYFKNL